MKVRFVYPRFQRHAEAHPELLDHVPCNEYFGPPSLGIASLAAITPSDWSFDFRDDRVEDVGLDDEGIDLVAISSFTAAARRAMELADAFRARGRKVVIGGIFATMMPEEVAPHVDAIVIGEGERAWRQVLADARAGTLRPIYTDDAPFDLATIPLPRVDLYIAKENDQYRPDDYPVQVSRGCPLSCSACALPKSMGARLRPLPVDQVLGQIEQLGRHGKLASFTEDTSFFPGSGASRRFGEMLDLLVERQGRGRISYVGISMPMVITTPPALYARMRNAGINMFYLVGGFDRITQRAFTGRDPKALERAYDAIRIAFDEGIEPYTSFLVGNDDDDEGTFDRMLEFANRAGIRKAEFAIMTPYPGTPVWDRLVAEERILSRDWSRYNDANVVFRPKQMSPDRLLDGYLLLWREFYRARRSLQTLDREERTIQF